MQWRLLLQYDHGNDRSDLDDDFFLSEKGASDPRAEMTALVAALEKENSNVRCRFPARVLWLAKELNRSDWLSTKCEELDQWARFDQIEYVSLVLVSGYLGNPASSFGHSLMKIRYSGEHQGSHLMGLGINFGANVPESEPMILYIFNGLFGGYEAAFSDNTFYAHDQTYARSEFRDMWEYPLALNSYQKKLLVYALWELKDQRFEYYFLTKNCGYRLAQLVELATNNELVSGVEGWYFPVELFLDIGDDSYSEPIFHPSSQRVLLARIQNLSESSKRLAKQVMEMQLMHMPVEASFYPLTSLSNHDEQHKVLDALLAFYEFQDIANRYGEESPWKTYRQSALSRRFKLPISTYAAVEPVKRISAKDTDRPASLRFDKVYAGDDSFEILTYKAVDFGATSYTDLLGSELEVLELGIAHSEDQLFLHKLTLASVTRILDADSNLPGYLPISWHGSAGWGPESYSCFECSTLYVSGGIGLAKSISSRWLHSSFLNMIYQRSIDSLFAEVEWKIFNHSTKPYSLEFGFKYGTKSIDDEEYGLAFVNARYHLFEDWNLKLRFADYVRGNLKHTAGVGIEHRF